MVKDQQQIVRLSGKDWVGLLALAVGLLGAITTQYLRHDRLLTQVLVRQEAMAERLGQVERAVERLEAGEMGRARAAAPPTPIDPGVAPPLSLSNPLHHKDAPHQNSHG
tara:strand:- start:8223 stop:8549 length:327 start_codon:yes stop_codon:yes gene_type:complete